MVKPKFEERKESNPYDKMPWDELLPKLYGWAKMQKLMPGFFPMGIYHDDTKQVPPEKCRSEIGITFKGQAIEAGDIRIKAYACPEGCGGLVQRPRLRISKSLR